MSTIEKLSFSTIRKNYPKGVLIPEIQRDYVMGAGGTKEGSEKDKLEGLLDALLDRCQKGEKFDFSCIITYCADPDMNRLEIYDGQQRLTTLMLLIMFCFHRENSDKYEEYKYKEVDENREVEWYQFSGRPVANNIVRMLTDRDFQVDKIPVKDFTSFSMKNLLEKFSYSKYDCITSDYLLNQVMFERVELGSQNEIEQFFMDLNSGVKLKKYELYKAKLVHHINELSEKGEDKNGCLREWPHKLDNEWLNTFMAFADFSHPAEEYEIAFIQYCFFMLLKNDNHDADTDDPDNMTPEILSECFSIMQAMSNLDFVMASKRDRKPHMVEFAWGSYEEECKENRHYFNYDKRGAYWNLNFKDNEYHLYYIIKDILTDKENIKELSKDIIIWAYIISLSWQIDYQSEFIPLLKSLLNHNVSINKDAWYECQEKGQYLYYSKYNVCFIPQYYGKHLKENESKENGIMHDCIWELIECFRKHKEKWPKSVNPREISSAICQKMLEYLSDRDDRISCIIKERTAYLGTDNSYIELCENENKTNGIMREIRKDYDYLSMVDFWWPIRGGKDSYRGCYILLNCYMDKIYEEYNMRDNTSSESDKYNDIVKGYKDKHKDKGNSMFIPERCFWDKNLDYAYRIYNRVSDSSQTYTKYGGTEKNKWAYYFDKNGNFEIY